MPFPNAPETPGGQAGPLGGQQNDAGGAPTPQGGAPSEPAQTSPEPAGQEYDGGGIDLVRVPHPDFEGGTTPQPGQAQGPQPGAAQSEPGPDPAQAAQGGETPPQDGEGNKPGQTQGQTPPAYMTLKHRGREIPVDSEDKARALAQMGLDYSAKTHAIAPIVQRYPALIQALSNPELAAKVDAVLHGQALPGQDPGQGQGQGQPQGQPIMITDPETGQPVPVDQNFLAVLDQWAQAKGISRPKPDETLLKRLEALESTAPAPREVADRQVEAVSQHIKATLGFDDFKEAVPMVIESMAAQGITRGDPRDNPETWLNIYKDLRLTGRFTGKRETTVKPKADLHQTKVAAAGAGPAPGTKQGGIDWKATTKKALESGRTNDMVEAVASRISHPDFA